MRTTVVPNYTERVLFSSRESTTLNRFGFCYCKNKYMPTLYAVILLSMVNSEGGKTPTHPQKGASGSFRDTF